MANEVDYSPIKYVGNGATIDFSFDWKVIDTDELIVELEEIETGETTVQTRGSDYTATINSVGGAVTFTTAPSSDYYVVLSRATSQYQSKSYSTSTGFQGSEVEKSFDKVSCNLQEMDYNIETFKEDVQNEVSDFESTLSDFEDALTVSFETFKAELTEEINTTISENKADTDSQISEFEEEINSTLSTVIEAADKINALEEAVETATEQASSAASSAANASETLEEITTLAQELEENIENLADTDLSNLSDTGLDKLNQSKAMETGAVSSDTDVYADVLSYAHSTFDSSKCTVTGDVTITNDGIASGFSTANLLSGDFSDTINMTTDTFRIKGRVTWVDNSDITSYPMVFALENSSIRLSYSTKSTFYFYYASDSSTTSGHSISIPISNSYDNMEFDFDCYWNGATAACTITVDGIEYTNSASYTDYDMDEISTVDIGCNLYSTYTWGGSIDLKYFSVERNGVTVFSCNKTGTDTYTIDDETIEIPYTLSKTGSKIVEYDYIDSVQAVYDEYGYAPYYTIDEDNETFTLPMGEVYGMIENKTDTNLYNLTQTGENKLNYNVFCINTGDTTDAGEPAFLSNVESSTITTSYSSSGISNFAVDNSVYFDTADYDTYTFTYDGSDWLLDDTAVTLSDYGISYDEKFSASEYYASDTITSVSFASTTFLNEVENTAGTYTFTYEYAKKAVTTYTISDVLESETIEDYTIDQDTFLTAVDNTEGDYIFTASVTETTDGDETTTVTTWTLDDVEVDLADYGITLLEGEPTDGDTITVTVGSETVYKYVLTWTLDDEEISLDDYGITYEGEPTDGDTITVEVTSLLAEDDTITVTVTQTFTLTTSGEFDVTTAVGKTYTITDTLTLDITDYEEGTYNVYVNPVDLSLSVIDNTITYGITFPDDAADGDYLLNTAKVPYDLQKINITTDEDTEETATTITTGLYDVYAGVLVIES